MADGSLNLCFVNTSPDSPNTMYVPMFHMGYFYPGEEGAFTCQCTAVTLHNYEAFHGWHQLRTNVRAQEREKLCRTSRSHPRKL